MVLPKLTFLSWFVHVKANHCHKFTKWKFEDTKCKHGRPYWIWIPSFFWQLETSAEVMEVDKQLKFNSHQRMQVEFISNNIDVMTHVCLSSLALALQTIAYKIYMKCISNPVAWGDQNSADVCPCACRKRRLIIGYKLSYTTGLLNAWSSCMQWGVWVWTGGRWVVLVQVIYCSKGRWVLFF